MVGAEVDKALREVHDLVFSFTRRMHVCVCVSERERESERERARARERAWLILS